MVLVNYCNIENNDDDDDDDDDILPYGYVMGNWNKIMDIYMQISKQEIIHVCRSTTHELLLCMFLLSS